MYDFAIFEVSRTVQEDRRRAAAKTQREIAGHAVATAHERNLPHWVSKLLEQSPFGRHSTGGDGRPPTN